MTLKDAIDAYQSEHGLTQEGLARRLGTTQSNLSRVRNGERRVGHQFAKRAEARTGIPRHLWRPDIWDPPKEGASEVAA